MISKEEFLSIPKMARDIAEEKNRIAVMRAKLYSPRGLDTSDKVQSSGSQTALADIVIDKEQRLESRVCELDRLREEAERIILGNDILSDDEIMLMLLRYSDCKTWREITETIHYGIATTYRMNRNALDILFDED